MGALRQVVLPALRLLVWAVIAVALCVLAFGRGGAVAAQGPLQPSAGAGDAVVEVERGDLTSTLVLTGTVSADPASTVRATAAGTVSRVRAQVGAAVQPGTPLLDVVQALEPVEQPAVVAADGTTTQRPPKPRTRTVTITAGSAGTLASVAVLEDQDVAVGTDVATVTPGTLSVTAPLTQSQQFRLLTPPASARAQATGGPAPFDCTDVRTGVPAAGEQAPSSQPSYDPYTGMPAAPSTAQVTCRVPAGTTVFAGMSVEVSLELGTATGALVVPVTAVLGTVERGTAWVVGPDGAPVEREVALGLTDGSRLEVREGLTEGEQVLEFAPVPSDDEAVLEGALVGG